MISRENLGSIAGAPVQGADDDRIGTVGQIFADPVSGVPTWVTVHTGLFGRHETFVPLQDATWDREVLHIPYDKDLVKDAPRIDTEGGLQPDMELELSRYYGLNPVTAGTEEPSTSASVPAADQSTVASPPAVEPNTAASVAAESVAAESAAEESREVVRDEPLDPQRRGRHRA